MLANIYVPVTVTLRYVHIFSASVYEKTTYLSRFTKKKKQCSQNIESSILMVPRVVAFNIKSKNVVIGNYAY